MKEFLIFKCKLPKCFVCSDGIEGKGRNALGKSVHQENLLVSESVKRGFRTARNEYGVHA